MFTGLVETLGEISALEEIGDNTARRLRIAPATAGYLSDVEIGESISVNGVCLTVTEFNQTSFAVEAVEETLRRSSLGALQVGSPVNLERALRATARLGGHIVQGHVDGVGTVVAVREEGEGWWISFEPPADLMRYIVEKGSICIDGISLTVANVSLSKFAVALIPHTRQMTTARDWAPGQLVNLEVDVVAKYVERLMQWQMARTIES